MKFPCNTYIDSPSYEDSQASPFTGRALHTVDDEAMSNPIWIHIILKFFIVNFFENHANISLSPQNYGAKLL